MSILMKKILDLTFTVLEKTYLQKMFGKLFYCLSLFDLEFMYSHLIQLNIMDVC